MCPVANVAHVLGRPCARSPMSPMCSVAHVPPHLNLPAAGERAGVSFFLTPLSRARRYLKAVLERRQHPVVDTGGVRGPKVLQWPTMPTFGVGTSVGVRYPRVTSVKLYSAIVLDYNANLAKPYMVKYGRGSGAPSANTGPPASAQRCEICAPQPLSPPPLPCSSSNATRRFSVANSSFAPASLAQVQQRGADRLRHPQAHRAGGGHRGQ
jgi:hypothetical protein